jgi:hypothetical protein
LTEQSMRATFSEIAADITGRPPDLPFDELQRLVDGHLSAKSQQ